jgi:hypothetical protein
MTAGDADLWKRTTALKQGNPSLKVFLSIGGWTFNDPPTQHRFSDLASSEANMNTFARSCFDVMQTYGFDVCIFLLHLRTDIDTADRALTLTGNTPPPTTEVASPRTRRTMSLS